MKAEKLWKKKSLFKTNDYFCRKKVLKKIISLSLLLLFYVTANKALASEDWGQNGHRSTAQIAQKHLSKKAIKRITKLLDGSSIAVASTFADEIKSDNAFRGYSKWHYVNIPTGKTYAEVEKELGENAVWGIEECIAKLQSKDTERRDQQFYLKMLVHLVGDLHQPLHVGNADDKGGNDIDVKWFGKNSNLHRVWDSNMIDSYDMSFTELSTHAQKLSKTEIKSVAKGNAETWAMESRIMAESIYKSVEENKNLGYRYMYDWFPQLKIQLQKGGIRLAKILNEIYG